MRGALGPRVRLGLRSGGQALALPVARRPSRADNPGLSVVAALRARRHGVCPPNCSHGPGVLRASPLSASRRRRDPAVDPLAVAVAGPRPRRSQSVRDRPRRAVSRAIVPGRPRTAQDGAVARRPAGLRALFAAAGAELGRGRPLRAAVHTERLLGGASALAALGTEPGSWRDPRLAVWALRHRLGRQVGALVNSGRCHPAIRTGTRPRPCACGASPPCASRPWSPPRARG